MKTADIIITCLISLFFGRAFSQEVIDSRVKDEVTKYESILRETTEGDSVKKCRCYEKLDQYALAKVHYFRKWDSLLIVRDELNDYASGYTYNLILTKRVNFDWGDCKRKDLGNGTYKTFVYCDYYNDLIDFDPVFEEVSKFRIHFGDSGATFYREDLK